MDTKKRFICGSVIATIAACTIKVLAVQAKGIGASDHL